MSIPELTAPLDLSPAAYIVRTSQGGLRIAGTRVGLESVVYAWRGGETPEQTVANYPTLSVEQVHGALAFYFRNREAIDRYMLDLEVLFEKLRSESEEQNREFRERLLQRAAQLDAGSPSR
ncbi:MAG: DUF433 domain-containing protein [Planctomycetaceae bacterium]